MNFKRHDRHTGENDWSPKRRAHSTAATTSGNGNNYPEVGPALATSNAGTYEKWASVAFVVLMLICLMVYSYRKGVQDSEEAEATRATGENVKEEEQEERGKTKKRKQKQKNRRKHVE